MVWVRWGRFAVPGVLALAVVAAVNGQAPANARYVGSKMCLTCHMQHNPEIVTGFPATAHMNAMAEATDENVKADFANAPFAREQVAFTFGSGHRQQAYLDENFQVLPGKWVIAEQRWEPIEAVDAKTQCIGCHVTGFDAEKGTWKAYGVGCEGCHGPGSVHALATGEAIKNTILDLYDLDPHEQAQVCGQCHAPGLAKDGVHMFPHTYRPGDDLEEHFDLGEPVPGGMNQQYADLIRSPKHWDNEVICSTCHDPHVQTGNEWQLRRPVTEQCLSCHRAAMGTTEAIPNLEDHVQDKGVTAPLDATCATCHMPDGRHTFRTDAVMVPQP